ncbi:MAG TPA: lipase maturation factor family protein [Thermoanaerobaculia bacterium]|nr:lipase maturation factor family protein [Thermoanaerobaculia bacterium]
MADSRRVALPPARPLLLFDGECGFCRVWIARWKAMTGDRVDYAPSQEAGARFPEIPAEAFRRSVQLVLPDGEVRSGAHAVATTLDLAGRGFPLRAYERVPGAAPAAEAGYAFIAAHRTAASRVTRLLWGSDVTRPEYAVASALFLRLLGLVFLAAFLSLFVQVEGLIGSRGILPIAELLPLVAAQTGLERFWLLPTLCWAASGDAALQLFCGAGAVFSVLLAAGLFPAASLAAATVLYLSLSVAGQTFFAFQWDFLLIETAFLAIFLAPLSARLRFPAAGPSRAALFLLRWLLFRLCFSSGAVKLASGDPTWRDLTALSHYYETQPLPPWTAWYAHQLPLAVQKASTLLVFFFELVVPFLIFAPRRLRHAAFGLLVLFQAAISSTGNYTFFNILTALLCLLLLDDRFLDRLFRARPPRSAASAARSGRWPRPAIAAVALLVLPIGAWQVASLFRASIPAPFPIPALAQAVAPFRIVNGYGLFAILTIRRPEILVEGSDDGRTWKAYEFRWKPGDVLRRPPFVAPHQPRLDWQMWFAALGSFEADPWFGRLLVRLLEGSPEVLALLARNPFPDRPPRFVRARLWDYRFTDPAGRRETGAWWRREEIGAYGPVLGRP